MWKKALLIIIIFYFFALLQNSFFTHFNLFGATPNLVFLLFFLLVFFSAGSGSVFSWEIILYSTVAGIFLDFFSGTYLGVSIIFLAIIGFLLKKAQLLLQNRDDNYPFLYFLPLFIGFFTAYNLLFGLAFYFLESGRAIVIFGAGAVFSIIYNALVAAVLFYIYRKIPLSSKGNRQLTLFRKD